MGARIMKACIRRDQTKRLKSPQTANLSSTKKVSLWLADMVQTSHTNPIQLPRSVESYEVPAIWPRDVNTGRKLHILSKQVTQQRKLRHKKPIAKRSSMLSRD